MINYNNNDNEKGKTSDAQCNCSPPADPPFQTQIACPSLYTGHDVLWGWNIPLLILGHLC